MYFSGTAICPAPKGVVLLNQIATFLREARVACFLLPAGIICIVFGIFFLSASIQNQGFLPAEATVTGVEVFQEAYVDAEGNRTEATYRIEFRYEVNGAEHHSDLSGVSEYKPGDKLTVYYNPDDPDQVTQTKSIVLPAVIIAGGAAALIGGIVSIVLAVKRNRKLKEQEKEWANG